MGTASLNWDAAGFAVYCGKLVGKHAVSEDLPDAFILSLPFWAQSALSQVLTAICKTLCTQCS